MTPDPTTDAPVSPGPAAAGEDAVSSEPAASSGPVASSGAAGSSERGAEEVTSAPEDAEEPIDAELAEVEAAVESDLDALQHERDDYLDALRRLQADFENYKKRTLKQQTEHLERAARSLVDKLLPVLDAADLAIAHGAGETVGPIATLLTDTLGREGLEAVDPKPGEAFDPTVHEAVAHEPGDGAHQEVSDVLRAGYRWKGALLRPAMVKVRG